MMGQNTKYIFITGGVVSSLGKGIVSASLGRILKAQGYRVSIMKLDPYINVDPGTMSPFQHGEVFVTEDGAETDLDLGHYERFLGEPMRQDNNFTAGKVYQTVIEKERRGVYLGNTVQVVPHITDEIKRRIYSFKPHDEVPVDILIVEIGGTIGDIESLPFLEAIRQVGLEKHEDTAFIHLSLVPTIAVSDEIKTKPTQHTVKELRSIGIQPDVLVCRAEKFLNDEDRKKIALFTNVPIESVITSIDIDSVYKVPLVLADQKLDEIILKKISLPVVKKSREALQPWTERITRMQNPHSTVTIALVGKYSGLKDSYKSITEALVHAGAYLQIEVDIKYLKTEEMAQSDLRGVHGIIVPGGFGERGMADKATAIKYAREARIPYFGLCLGMQLAVIEFARNVLELEGADSTECNPETPHPVVTILDGLGEGYGGTLRLGDHICNIREGTLLHEAYNCKLRKERHRHRYEFNNEYREQFQTKGMKLSALSFDNNLVEAVELATEFHPWFVGVQFHPEFASTFLDSHPLFVSYLKAVKTYAWGRRSSVRPAHPGSTN